MSEPSLPPDAPNPKRALAVLVLMLALGLGAWFLVQKMSADSSIQDCVMSGRKNCAPVGP